jgi:hypothetical protein
MAAGQPTGSFMQFETFDDRIINLFAFSETPLFYDTTNGKVTPEKIDSAVFQLSPEANSAVCGKLDKYLNLYDFAAHRSTEIYSEKRSDYLLRKYFWFPAERKIIISFDIRQIGNSFIGNEIIAIDPITKVTKTVSPPCPAISWKKKPILNQLLKFLPDRSKTP